MKIIKIIVFENLLGICYSRYSIIVLYIVLYNINDIWKEDRNTLLNKDKGGSVRVVFYD